MPAFTEIILIEYLCLLQVFLTCGVDNIEAFSPLTNPVGIGPSQPGFGFLKKRRLILKGNLGENPKSA